MYIYSQPSRWKSGSINSIETRREMNLIEYVHPRKKTLTTSPGKSKRSTSLIKTIAAKPQNVYLKEHGQAESASFINMHLKLVNFCIYNMNWMIWAIYCTRYLPPMSFWARLTSNSTFISLATVEVVTCISSVHQQDNDNTTFASALRRKW